jgi:branched-chain amino acid transport system permease protein
MSGQALTRPNLRLLLLAALALGLIGLAFGTNNILHVLILCLIWTIVVAAWDMTMGYAGIFNFAQLALFTIGGYGSAMLAMHGGVPTLLAPFAAAALTALAGLLIALPCLRLRGEYVALFTFAVHLALPTILEKGRAVGTGGATGLIGIPPIRVPGFAFTAAEKLAWFLLALVAATVVIWLVYGVILSGRLGRAFVALRDSAAFARSLGVDDRRNRLALFVLSAALTGFGGALYAHYVGVMTPRVLGNEFFLMVMLMLSVGGLGHYPGVLLGAFAVTIGNELLRDTGEFRLLILGAVVLLVILYLPGGIGGLFRRQNG